ncbi:MAG TPA: 4,5-DOPA dioxygenase extradiol [Anaerolineaceae bacterium]
MITPIDPGDLVKHVCLPGDRNMFLNGAPMGSTRMPVLFIGHGSPMNAIEDNEFSQAWREVGKSLPRPKGIVVISAHWETQGTLVTVMDKPRTIHDFYGFPRPLFEFNYPAPGDPVLAEHISNLVKTSDVNPDLQWGLDHGSWSVLARLFPEADIPVVQMSLDRAQGLPFHFELGRQLQALRDEDVLIIGSGNVVHNLRMMVWEERIYDWAADFDSKIKQWILEGDTDSIIHYEKYGHPAELSVNTEEHYLPLLYVLGLKHPQDTISFFNEKVWGGSLSMRCVQFSA